MIIIIFNLLRKIKKYTTKYTNKIFVTFFIFTEEFLNLSRVSTERIYSIEFKLNTKKYMKRNRIKPWSYFHIFASLNRSNWPYIQNFWFLLLASFISLNDLLLFMLLINTKQHNVVWLLLTHSVCILNVYSIYLLVTLV